MLTENALFSIKGTMEETSIKWLFGFYNLFLVECSFFSYKYHLICDQCDLETYFYYFLTLKTALSFATLNIGVDR